MNTIDTTQSGSGSSVASVATSPALTSVEQEIINLQAQLELANQKKAAMESEADTKRREIIAGLPALLGVGSNAEVIKLLGGRQPVSSHSSPRHPPPPTTSKNHTRLPDDTLTQMKAMLMGGATSQSIATALNVGLSTVDLYKHRWGLTRPRSDAQRARRQMERGQVKRAMGGASASSSNNPNHLTATRRANIVAALLRPDAHIATIATRFGVSRQTVYNLRTWMNNLRNKTVFSAA